MATVDNSRLERDGSLSRNGTNNSSAERSRASGSNATDGRVNLENIILVYESQLDFRGPNQAKMVLDRMTWLHRFDAEDRCHRVNAPR